MAAEKCGETGGELYSDRHPVVILDKVYYDIEHNHQDIIFLLGSDYEAGIILLFRLIT